MSSFTKVAALAALAAYANAVCDPRSVSVEDLPDNAGTFIDVPTYDCDSDNALAIQDAVATYAGDNTWSGYVTQTGYQNLLIRFTGDAAGAAIVDANGVDIQGSKGQVLFTHTATKDCLSWLTSTSDDATASIPQMLFESGYDVFLACRRGTQFSRSHETFDLDTKEGLADYFDYNTSSVGEEDIGAFIDLINTTVTDEGLFNCSGAVQIVAHSLGTGEVLAGLAGDATLADKVNFVTNLAPCAVPTYLNNGAETEEDSESSHWHRMLSQKQEPMEAPRELEAIVEEDMPKRELGHGYWKKESYWDRTKRYCSYYPSSCYNYCDWYPSYCDEFCEQLPEFCVPEQIRNYYALQDIYDELCIDSLYGPDWEAQVDAICEKVSWSTCDSFKDTVGAGLAEMSVTQLEHMWQMSYNRSFSAYSADFDEDQTTTDIDVSGVNTRMVSFYVDEDPVCDTDVNQGVFDTVPGQMWRSTFVTEGITHSSIQGANNESGFLNLLNVALAMGQNDVNGDPVCTQA